MVPLPLPQRCFFPITFVIFFKLLCNLLGFFRSIIVRVLCKDINSTRKHLGQYLELEISTHSFDNYVLLPKYIMI